MFTIVVCAISFLVALFLTLYLGNKYWLKNKDDDEIIY